MMRGMVLLVEKFLDKGDLARRIMRPGVMKRFMMCILLVKMALLRDLSRLMSISFAPMAKSLRYHEAENRHAP